ncbi:MAG: MarR family winged helix-turn-helix transcriptional regulator [Jatrophihabitantaceae bacterium]
MSGLPAPDVPSSAAGAGDPPLSPGDWRLSAWRAFLRTHTHLLRILEQDLQAHHKIAIGTYDVLVQLAEASEHRLRMSELAEAVLLSRSGLTRLVDRMQKDGLVERQPDPFDARGLFTVLTEQGLQALRDAATVHLAGISRLVFSRLSEDELRLLFELMGKLDPVPVVVEASDASCGLG